MQKETGPGKELLSHTGGGGEDVNQNEKYGHKCEPVTFFPPSAFTGY